VVSPPPQFSGSRFHLRVTAEVLVRHRPSPGRLAVGHVLDALGAERRVDLVRVGLGLVVAGLPGPPAVLFGRQAVEVAGAPAELIEEVAVLRPPLLGELGGVLVGRVVDGSGELHAAVVAPAPHQHLEHLVNAGCAGEVFASAGDLAAATKKRRPQLQAKKLLGLPLLLPDDRLARPNRDVLLRERDGRVDVVDQLDDELG